LFEEGEVINFFNERGIVMTKWEYCVIDVEVDGQAKVVFLQPPGEKHHSEKIEEIYQVIARLGLEGWELVSHTLTEAEYFTFKRPLTDEIG
jgi:hypothetical protein